MRKRKEQGRHRPKGKYEAKSIARTPGRTRISRLSSVFSNRKYFTLDGARLREMPGTRELRVELTLFVKLHVRSSSYSIWRDEKYRRICENEICEIEHIKVGKI